MMLLLALIVALLALLLRKAPSPQTPWCEAEVRTYRCHLPRGHEGPHWCDDWTGEFAWSVDP